MKRLNKKAVLENVDLITLYKPAKSAISEYIRVAAIQKLEKNPKWNHDASEFDNTFSNVLENNNIKLNGFLENMVEEEINAILEDYPLDQK